MRKNAARRAESGPFQYGGPEQHVKVHDVLADEMVDLCVIARAPVFVEVEIVAAIAQIAEARGITHRCIQPHVEVLVIGAGNAKSEVGCVPGYVPVP